MEVDQRFVRAGSPEANHVRAQTTVDSMKQSLTNGLKAIEQFADDSKELTTEQTAAKVAELNPVPTYIKNVLQVVEVFPEAPATFDAALTGLAYAKDSNRNLILDYLMTQWPERLNHQKIVAYLLKQVPDAPIEEFLRKSIEHAPKGQPHADALLGFKTYFDQKPLFSDMLRLSPNVAKQLQQAQLDYIHTKRTDKQSREVARYLQIVIDDYADLKFESMAMGAGDTYGEVATSELYELEHLSVGNVAPDIAGTDLDGIPFKLSDYRGKVVMLDFWGHWCPPCRRMYPHERDLVQKLSGLPFALIGVNSDEDIETARQAVLDDPLPWRNFWNGPKGTSGPISKQWNISDWPTFYLIDGKGVIRYKGILGDDIRVAIETLMAESGHPIDLSPIAMASR